MKKGFCVLFVCFLIIISCDMRELPPPSELQPFYQAILQNDMETVQQYIKKYKHIANFVLADVFNTRKQNTVTTAVVSGNIEMLQLMLSQKADYDFKNQPGGFTALQTAIQMKRQDMVKILLDKGADPTITDDNSDNVFHEIAREFRDVETAKLFQPYAVQLINNRNTSGFTPLTFLVIEQYDDEYYSADGVLDLLKFYLDNGADVILMLNSVKDYDLLYGLIQNKMTDYLKLLFSYAKGKLPDRIDGTSYLQTAAYYAYYDLIPILIPLTSNINSADKYGLTALHSAAVTGELEIIKLLLNSGADKTLKGPEGLTPYDAYVKYGEIENDEISELLQLD